VFFPLKNSSQSGQGSIEAWFPRGLVCDGQDVLSAPVTSEGLSPLRIHWKKGRVSNIEILESSKTISLKLLLPRLIEPHAHIDKGFTWEKFPNLSGTYEGALKLNYQEHKLRTPEIVRSRAEKALRIGLKNGLRSVRTHIDSFGLRGSQSWDVLNDLKIQWQNFIELQCVALVPLEYWSTGEGYLLATKVASQEGFLGGVLVPPFDKQSSYRNLFNLIETANKIGCGIDLHIDESSQYPAAGITQLMKVLEHINCQVPITCSHSSSMALLPPRKLKYFADQMARHNISVVALPLTNGWLLGRQERKTPVIRPLAPVRQLQQSGVSVAIGGDNVQDPWFPLGNLDPIALMSDSIPLTQLAPWERLGLSAYTSSAAALMGLEWDGTIKTNAPAEFVVLNARTWSEALSSPPSRQHIINGNWFDENLNAFKLNS
tara:strand:- start:9758 stop:11050 length:1293 start_codon:yes stop_codon:yes gene_type:complete